MSLRSSKPKTRRSGIARSCQKKDRLEEEAAALERDLFRLAVQGHRCPVCKRKCQPGMPAHHVVYEQHLRDRGLPTHDRRDALFLCPGALGCHGQHHARRRVVKTKELRDENIDYAFEVLGDYAGDYLRRYPDDSDPDPRITARMTVAA